MKMIPMKIKWQVLLSAYHKLQDAHEMKIEPFLMTDRLANFPIFQKGKGHARGMV